MKTSAERLAWALKNCKESHLRMTAVRRSILRFLSQQRTPVSLVTISQEPGVGSKYNETTVYRTLMVFKDAGLVRCVGTVRKESHFILNVPGDCNHFLICERCGSMLELELTEQTLRTMRELAVQHGFAATGQCLEIQGTCRACEEAARRSIVTTKVMSRHSHEAGTGRAPPAIALQHRLMVRAGT
jgi:Fe2+ or Zn2+ uptake regulation protein